MNFTDRNSARYVAPIALLAAALFTSAFAAGCAGDPPSCVGSQCDKNNGDGDGDGDGDPPKPSEDPPELQDDDPTNDQANGETGSLDQENTFEHPGDLDGETRDPFDILAQRAEEGPPEVRTRLHSCQKVTVATLRQILTQFGVDLEAEGNPPTAGQLLNGGGNALGASNYGARASESLVWTAAGAAKMFDIFVQAAPEIIANAPNQAVCQVTAGTPGPALFDDEGICNKDAISCLIGTAATDAHVAICNSAVVSASDLEKGKSIAVASLLSAAHSCD
jgi:hypothetical protein